MGRSRSRSPPGSSNGRSEEGRKRPRSPSPEPSAKAPSAMDVPMPDDDETLTEAERIARIAARAEAKAAARAVAAANGGINGRTLANGGAQADVPQVTFLTKKEREQLALQRLQEKRSSVATGGAGSSLSASASSSSMPPPSRRDQSSDGRDYRDRDRDNGRDSSRGRGDRDRDDRDKSRLARQEAREEREREKERQALKDAYLGKKEVKKRVVKPSEKFAKIFQFDWNPSEDTSKDSNPFYNQRLEVTPLFGRGYVAGVDMREQRKHNRYLEALTLKRQEVERQMEEESGVSRSDRRNAEEERQSLVEDMRRRRAEDIKDMEKATIGLIGKHWRDKQLSDMTERDWRIFREDYDIQIRGNKTAMPLRNWEEGKLPKPIMKAIEELEWKEPSPIQRAAIPIGLERRDIIGIAETGSGKTGAFAIPMINYCLSVPQSYRDRAPEEGPLAVVMAPTRELAEQIEDIVSKLIKFSGLKSVCGVGGKPIEDQGLALRKGVAILIGTPGRLVDLIESRYLVLNQCNYVVLDEADRMVDMGFEESVTTVLESMAGLLKSEVEEEAELQAEKARKGEELYRVTAMFSATMPQAVERIARSYLRHPATVKIGDQNSSKNKRITQNVMFTTEPQKKNILMDIINKSKPEDKFIVFVNAKRACDVLSRTLESSNIYSGILHGGKTQEQRESSLESFRSGEFQVLVATDVAARGLDIPDVTHVINYDMPQKIDSYCHRIGRTGRAGREGIATTLLTDNDADVLYDLKAYLESTDMAVPSQLAKHPAAQQAPGARGEDGKPIKRREQVVHAKF